ncbi:hypothetical protein GCM10010912_26220 [Paenibacillus albidus]|uniref:Uncharacterized protein n=1 Tax=Paenibacillus albidus TaxID=2041023 RepID=A0A917CAC4_9BACL|nr:hypothetical protein GCM10010912_26220 [Paenibacillus albidus]
MHEALGAASGAITDSNRIQALPDGKKEPERYTPLPLFNLMQFYRPYATKLRL